MIADFFKIVIANVKELVPNFFDKEKYVFHYENLRLGLKLKKNTSRHRIQPTRKCLMLVIIRLTQKTMIVQTN